MDTVRRMKLQTLREKIVQDVHVEYIFDYLISKDVLSEDELERIKGEKTRKDRTRHLLDLLPKKNIDAFEHFVQALKGPYPWLSEQLEAEGPESYQVEEKSFFDSLLLGGLPQSPPHNVERKEKVEEVRQHLHSLRRGHYVVLHGMTGSGKSCLAAAALDNKQLVIEKFKGAVYWIGVGDINTERSGDLLCHMTDLMEKLSHHPEVELKRQVQSSTSINGARESLRRYFTSDALREGLLILDDVSSPEVIEAFDVGCKILVTTKDSWVMNSVEGRQCLVKVSEGFLEQESLCLMAKCVGVDISQLPPQAKKIHKLCKGVPMVIALIGAQLADNKDDVQRNPGRWNYYLDTLTRRDYGKIKRLSFSQEDGMLGAIGLCVDNLPDDMKCFYHDFALFVEDVNIRPEVLETLWSRNKYEVEDIMSEFLKKSLAVSKWNELLNSYVYGIHDLLLYYLKHQLSAEEKKDLHRKLLNCYKSVSGGNFSNLPNDNYIYSYIGHHLNEAEMWSEFPNLYLDLEFIGAKLKITGPGDLLVDYKKYGSLITGGDEQLVAALKDFEQFIQSRGLDLHKYQDIDIVQCGLQEHRNSYIYEKALKIAKGRPNKLYLQFLLDHGNLPQPYTLSVNEEVFAACFTSKENKILTSNGNGTINLWDMEYAHILYTFQGHRQRILHLELSPDRTQFLSCSEDATVKLWKLEGSVCKNRAEEEFDEHGFSVKTPSPRMRQDNWRNMFSSDTGGDRSYRTFSDHQTGVLCATFSYKGDEVMSCSSDGSVKVWNCETGIVRLTFQVPSPGSFASSCIFSEDSSMILFGGNDSVVYVYDNNTGHLISRFETCGCVIAILDTADNEIAVVTDNSVCLWRWETGDKPCSSVNAQDLLKERSHNVIHSNKKAVNTSTLELSVVMQNIVSQEFDHSTYSGYTCATLSEDHQYIIVGASDSFIRVWDIEERRLVKEYLSHNGSVRCLDTFNGGSYQLLLCGSDDKTIKVWHIELAETEQETKLQQNSDAVWDGKSTDQCIPLLAALDNRNKLQLLRGRNIVTETVPERVTVKSCKLSSCGQFLVYGCCDGSVKMFQVKSKSTSVIIKLRGAVHYLQICNNDDLTVIAADEKNSLKVWKGKPNETGSVVTCAGQTDVVVQCFLTNMNRKLLSCAQDGSVKIWDIITGNLIDVLVGRITQISVTMADLSSNEDLLVLCSTSGSFLLRSLTLLPHPPYVEVQDNYSFQLDDSIRSCKLSHDALLLALGQDNGNIIIWDVTNAVILGTLNLHKSCVHNLLFSPPAAVAGALLISPPPIVLVSVADQIGWWDVSRLATGSCSQRRRMSSGQRRRRRSGGSPKISIKPLGESSNGCVKTEYLADVWFGKEGPKGKTELLGCVKLLGREASKVSASSNFSAFATVDASGIVYLMKIL